MCMSTPKMPALPKPEAEHVPTPVDETVVREMQERRRKARLRAGHAGTILTSGLEEATPRRATLLGE